MQCAAAEGARQCGQPPVFSADDLGAPFADGEFRALVLQTPQGQSQRMRADGTPELVAVQPLIEAGGKPVATMSLTVPLDNLYAAANRRMWTEMAFLLGGLVLSFAVAQVGVWRGVMRPLRRLLHATDELAEGRYVSRVPATGLQELTELGRRFDRMALTRQKTEAELRHSEENLAITLHSIGDGVIATDAQGRITRMNAVAERLTGWPVAQAMGQPLHEVFRIHGQDALGAGRTGRERCAVVRTPLAAGVPPGVPRLRVRAPRPAGLLVLGVHQRHARV